MYIRKTNSTNTLLLTMLQEQGETLPDGFTVYTYDQTAGRGQAGNAWESEAGKNLLFSRLLRPTLAPADLFRITQYVSIVIAQTLEQYTDGICIKWPNDIYWNDKKICGILIETGFAGNKIDYAVAGVGLNVNQQIFTSNAPNPISLCQIIKQETPLDELMLTINQKFEELYYLISDPVQLHQQYIQRLYHREGWHTYMPREVSTIPSQPILHQSLPDTSKAFLAQIIDVLPNGCMVLQQKDGTHTPYHFKEIQYILP